MCQINQLSSTSESVINLGHSAKQPLIRPSSDLGYGFEPTALFTPGAGIRHHGRADAGMRGCTRGGAGRWVPGGVYYRVPSQGQIEAYLMNYIEYEACTAIGPRIN